MSCTQIHSLTRVNSCSSVDFWILKHRSFSTWRLDIFNMLFPIKTFWLTVALAASTQSATIPRTDHKNNARTLLGSSFGLPESQTFDYVVVGGGTAGLAIAARLAEDGSRSVAVIEAGTFYEIANGNLSQIPVYGPAFSGKSPLEGIPTVDWSFVTTPQAVNTITKHPKTIFNADNHLGILEPKCSLCAGEMSRWKLCSQLLDVSKSLQIDLQEVGRSGGRQ